MDKTTPAPAPTRVMTGTGEDLDAASLWWRAYLSPLPPADREFHIKRAPALFVLSRYRAAVARAMALPEN
jgi:hypothetical protein